MTELTEFQTLLIELLKSLEIDDGIIMLIMLKVTHPAAVECMLQYVVDNYKNINKMELLDMAEAFEEAAEKTIEL